MLFLALAPLVLALGAVAVPVASVASSSASSSSSSSASSSSASSSSSTVSSSVASSSASSSAAASSSASSSSSSATTTTTSSAAAATSTFVVPTGWKYSACVAEGTSGRALTTVSTSSSSMTIETCLVTCKNAGYPLAGLEYAGECYCGGFLANGASLTLTSNQCNMPCSGNANETCGGPGAISLYLSTRYNAASLSADLTSQTILLPTGWNSVACYSEPSAGRALQAASTSSDYMTASMCLNYCSGKGYAYAGMEYGRECYCDDSIRNSAAATGTCNMPCSGAPQQVCGGSGALSVYQNPSLLINNTVSNSYSYQGCIQEVSGRALTGASTSSASMSVDTCTSFCSGKGFKYAAVEYGQECYCGNSFSNGASSSLFSGQCNMACAGNSKQTCGGPNALSLYSK